MRRVQRFGSGCRGQAVFMARNVDASLWRSWTDDDGGWRQYIFWASGQDTKITRTESGMNGLAYSWNKSNTSKRNVKGKFWSEGNLLTIFRFMHRRCHWQVHKLILTGCFLSTHANMFRPMTLKSSFHRCTLEVSKSMNKSKRGEWRFDLHGAPTTRWKRLMIWRNLPNWEFKKDEKGARTLYVSAETH